ncbi:MAG: hypothetical protein ED859_13415 [Desulfuromonadales bacterium]|nr:MAG: hypothetical protein ED859_13415 [Desulfuromonadales bacterium]
MRSEEKNICGVCRKDFTPQEEGSVFLEAGEWLAAEVWKDAGTLCPLCLENRAKLAMMYLHEHNT